MGRCLEKFRMDWCFIFNGLYEGSIAACLHTLISSIVYIAICYSVILFAEYYSGPGGIALGNEYREIRRHGRIIFALSHAEREEGETAVHSFAEARLWMQRKARQRRIMATSTVPNWLRRMFKRPGKANNDDSDESEEDYDDEGGHSDVHQTKQPLFSKFERKRFVEPSLWILLVSTANAVISIALFIAIEKKILIILLLWTILVLPVAFIADNAYQIYLFYLLLTMEPLWAHTGSTWFEMFIVFNIIMWIVRNLANFYSFVCITAYRNVSTQRRRKPVESSLKQLMIKVSLSSSLLTGEGATGATTASIIAAMAPRHPASDSVLVTLHEEDECDEMSALKQSGSNEKISEGKNACYYNDTFEHDRDHASANNYGSTIYSKHHHVIPKVVITEEPS